MCRKPWAFVCLVLLFAIAGAGCATVEPVDGAANLGPRVLKRVNEIRKARGLPPVAFSPRLARAARDHSRDIARHEMMGHRGSDGSRLPDRVKRVGYRYRLVAENVAAGQTTPKETVEAWMKSPGHRRNLLLRRVCRAGVGYARMPDEAKSTYTHYWTIVLARPPGNGCARQVSRRD